MAAGTVLVPNCMNDVAGPSAPRQIGDTAATPSGQKCLSRWRQTQLKARSARQKRAVCPDSASLPGFSAETIFTTYKWHVSAILG
jgi:hypothetical protein